MPNRPATGRLPSFLLARSLPVGVLGAGVALSLLLFGVVHQERRAVTARHFAELTEASQRAIEERVELVKESLRAGGALFEASESVERHEWVAFIGKTRITERVPGVTALGVLHAVRPGRAGAFIETRRADGAPGFDIRPFESAPGDALPDADAPPFHIVFSFVEPRPVAHGVIGADVSRDRPRALAALRACDAGAFAMTPPLELVQDGRRRRGLLFVAPVYRRGMLTDTPEQRRDAIHAWVYAPVVIDDLLRPVVEHFAGEVDFHLFAGDAPDPARLVYGVGGDRHVFDRLTSLDLDSTTYTLAWARRGGDGRAGVASTAMLAAGAALVAALVAGLIASLQSAARSAGAHRGAQRRFETFMEHAPVAAWIKDERLRYVYLNRRCAESFGLAPPSAVGGDDYGWLSEADAKRAREFDLAVLKADAPMERLQSFDSPNGRRDWLIFKFPLVDEDGGRSIAGAGIDITERQRALEELELAREAAETANRAKGEFLANMSHEIRTPMTAILGFADLLDDAECTPDDRQQCLEAIRRSGRHLLTIINDILDLSRIHADKLSVAPSACSPPSIIGEVVSLMRPQAMEKNLDLHVRYEGPIPRTVRTDPTRLRQILINILGNAIKFTNPGDSDDRIDIRVGLETPQNHPDPVMRIDVADKGEGLTPEQLGRVFQPFEQADNASTRRHGGAGLGLSISRHLAALLGGGVTATSEPGQGATFSITFRTGPLDGVEMLSPEECLSHAAGRRGAMHGVEHMAPGRLEGRVLLVEDGPDNQRLLTIHLRRAGLKVDVADNGRDAVDMALRSAREDDPYALILMDMQMPVMDGYEATRVLRDRGWRGPIVALTAHAMTGDDQRCRDAGCDGYASKPISRDSLLTTCARWLSASATPNV